MDRCAVVDIRTPKRYRLTGLWYGPEKPERVLIFVHGLTSSVFATLPRTLAPLVGDTRTGVLTFNNRGHDIVSKLYQDAPRAKKGDRRSIAGSAHEKFVDCVDDIQGAIDFARKQGAKDIFLAGHSTGCQKSIYWAHKKSSRGVKGIVLLAPVSDYAVASERKNLKAAVRLAKGYVKKGESFALLKGESYDAQRFLSLYTPDSPEELFTYAQAGKVPRILRGIRARILVLWAGKDEFNDRPVDDILSWFRRNLKRKDRVESIPDVLHGFRGAEGKVARAILQFMKESS